MVPANFNISSSEWAAMMGREKANIAAGVALGDENDEPIVKSTTKRRTELDNALHSVVVNPDHTELVTDPEMGDYPYDFDEHDFSALHPTEIQDMHLREEADREAGIVL
jgi:hypothetical protein